MKRPKLSITGLLICTGMAALVFAFWNRFGEYLLASVFLLASAVLVASCFTSRISRAMRKRCLIAVFGIATLVASLGPAAGCYALYDPGWWQTPKTKRVFLVVYNPVGRCLAFPTGPLREGYLGYLSFWMPKGYEVRDQGWGISFRDNGNHLTVGLF
ncbi:MAG: hypothetical protein AAF802_22000 [Planctomycetota bacterium]